MSIVLALVFTVVLVALVAVGIVVAATFARTIFSAPAAPSPARSIAPVRAGAPPPRPRAALSSEIERARVDERPMRLATWRYRELVRLGVEPVAAADAALRGVDAGGVRSLVDHGCEPALAVDILLPDDDRAGRAEPSP